MLDKDSHFWAWLAGSLAAIGGYLRYYLLNKEKTMDSKWWLEAATDVTASVFIGVVVFLIASPFIGETAASGLAGYAGHIGTRNTVLILRKYITREK